MHTALVRKMQPSKVHSLSVFAEVIVNSFSF